MDHIADSIAVAAVDIRSCCLQRAAVVVADYHTAHLWLTVGCTAESIADLPSQAVGCTDLRPNNLDFVGCNPDLGSYNLDSGSYNPDFGNNSLGFASHNLDLGLYLHTFDYFHNSLDLSQTIHRFDLEGVNKNSKG